MAAFILASVEVIDAERFAPYRAEVPKLVARHGGRYRARGGTLHKLQGDLGHARLTVIEFPSVAAAHAFVESADYAPWKRLREATTHSRIALLEEGALPA